MGSQAFWSVVAILAILAAAERPMASRRDGGADRRQAYVSVARRRSRGEILDMLVQRRRDKRAALRLMGKLLKKQ
jgi:hypothetical protein